jgi:MYXO-CTERM domain-containing protein
MITNGSWGDIDGDGFKDYAIGAAGFEYANSLLDDGRLHHFDHLLSAFSGGELFEQTNGEMRMPFLPAFPRVMEDQQFFVNPTIGDIDGDGKVEVIHTSAGSVVHAFNNDGEEPAGWPKFHGGWALASPVLGDVDGDGYLEVWTSTRDGYVWAWRTTSEAGRAKREWSGFRNDAKNTGNCHTPQHEYPLLPEVVEPEPGCGCEDDSDGAEQALIFVLLLGGPLSLRRRRKHFIDTP